MTNEITKDVLTHVAITFSKTKHYLTTLQNEKLKTLGDKERLILGNSFLRISSISEILPLSDYYKSHPKERPQYDNIKKFPDLPKSVTWSESKSKEKQIKMMEQMIIGITKFIDRKASPKNAINLREQMQTGLSLVKAGKKFKISSLINKTI